MADCTEEGLRASLARRGVPEHLHDGLVLWVRHGVASGSFLCAVLTNNLRDSFTYADDYSWMGLHDLVAWLHWDAPSGCWGSPEKVSAWCAGHHGEVTT